jgi:hypothetical protein
VAQDGETNRLEGLMFLGVYAILGLAFFFLPTGAGWRAWPARLRLTRP